MSNLTGILYVVATPIGNLEDISMRACRVLKEVDLILAEDTRHSKKLMTHLGINTPMMTYHDHNEDEVAPKALEYLLEGKNLALISDAGTPLISDPGYRLVKTLQERKIPLVSVPGPSALISALSVSGLATDKFIFEGYAPQKRTARRKLLQSIVYETRTVIFYESPHRILDFLRDAILVLGQERTAVLARELTKMYETVRHDSLGNLLSWLNADKQQQKGEIVVLIQGNESEYQADEGESNRILDILLAHSLSVKQAASVAAAITGRRKNDLYQLALKLSKTD